jgi:hypothetical protein
VNRRTDLPSLVEATDDHGAVPATSAEEADLVDRYDLMMRLADLFDTAGQQVRARSLLGDQVLHDADVADSAELSRPTWAEVEHDVRAATDGRHGLLGHGVDLDADALMVRSTVLTYRWIDELQEAAYRTLGSIAGRAIGYLAPEVELGGAVVSAGLIETDALDRDDVTGYLGELAANNPELMDHVAGGGGLLDGLQMRSLLTVGFLTGREGRTAALGGLRATGAAPMAADFGSALRDVAGGFVESEPTHGAPEPEASAAPRGLEGLMSALIESRGGIRVQRLAPHRYVAYLTGPGGGSARRLRLVGGDHTAYAGQVVRAVADAVKDETGARVMLVGLGQGGLTAAEVAAAADRRDYVIDQVVTAGSPAAQVPRIPSSTRVLSLEDRADPVALLGSLLNAGERHRVTVVFDGSGAADESPFVVGGRAADASPHPDLKAELDRLREAGYLAG